MNRAEDKLRKKVKDARRDATEIRDLAKDAIEHLGRGGAMAKTIVGRDLKDIIALATKMDARTGTIDPSAKKAARKT